MVHFEELPKEIQALMLHRQSEYCGFVNKYCFIRDITTTIEGFNWMKSPEGGYFWDKILMEGDIDHFYTKYPKEQDKVETKEKLLLITDLIKETNLKLW